MIHSIRNDYCFMHLEVIIMKKKTRKLVSLALCVVMAAVFLPAAAGRSNPPLSASRKPGIGDAHQRRVPAL